MEELQSTTTPAPPGGGVTESILASMRGTRPWTMFLAVLGFISVGFMVMAALLILVVSFTQSAMAGLGGVALALVYLVLAALYLLPSLFLFKYAQSIGRLLSGGGVTSLEEALAAQKSFWKLAGILAIVSVVITVVAMVVGAIIGIMGAAW